MPATSASSFCPPSWRMIDATNAIVTIAVNSSEILRGRTAKAEGGFIRMARRLTAPSCDCGWVKVFQPKLKGELP